MSKNITIVGWSDGINDYTAAMPTEDVERFKKEMDEFHGEDVSWTNDMSTDLLLDSYKGLDEHGFIVTA